MKPNRQIYLALLFMLAGCHTPPRPLPPPKMAPAIGSRVALASGDVWLRTGETKARVTTGAMLPEDAVVVLDKGARALLRLTDGTGIFLRDNTELRISAERVALERGEIWVDVPPDEGGLKRFAAGAVTVTASDAGFDLAASGDEVSVYVARGLAIVIAPGGRAEVESGERASVAPDRQTPAVTPMKFFDDWTGGMADRPLSQGIAGRATGRIYGIDRRNLGALPTELDIVSQQIQVVIRDGIAHTTVDQRFFNPAGADVEGWYWFTIPEDASVERFALEVNGQLIEGEMTERKQAAETYEEAVRKAVDPALLEWVDGRNFRARIFPIPAAGERRVVLSYTQILPYAGGVYRYVYPMGGPGEKRIQEFSLQVDLGREGQDYTVSTLQDARISEDGQMVSIRRSGYLPKADFLLELEATEAAPPLRTYRFSTGGQEADYVMARYAPEVDFGSVEAVPGDVVIVVDTSASGGETERQIRADAAEAVLRALSDTDAFAVISADLTPRVVYPAEGLSPATEAHVSEAMERLSGVVSAGATDLGEMFHVAFDLVHDKAQPAVVYIGDGRPTVGETTSAALAERLRRSLGDSRARLFTLAVGEAADHALLERMARMGGGRAFRIDTPDQTVQEALRFAGAVKTPTITELDIDLGAGLDQAFATVAGKVSEGEEVVVLARSHHELPERVTVSGRLGSAPFKRTYETEEARGGEYGYLPSLWAKMYLERLMGEDAVENRGTMTSLGLTYYLMTPYTSFLVLDSDEAFAAAGIQRRRTGRYWNGLEERRAPQTGAAPASGSSMAEEMNMHDEPDMENAAFKEEILAPEMPSAAPGPARRSQGGSSSHRGAAVKRRLAAETPADGRSSTDDGSSASKPAVVPAGPAFPTPRHRSLDARGVCSDAARRPLAQRRIIWMRKLAQTRTPSDWADLFFEAAARCELPRMQARRSLLSMIEAQARTTDETAALLREFSGHPKLQRFLRRSIIRRSLRADMGFDLYESRINWYEVQRGLGALDTPEKRLARIRELTETYPDDAAGMLLLVDTLIDADKKQEALLLASRLQRDGLAGGRLLEIICDLQAELGDAAEAKRTCSELVEFSDADPEARQRLGDLFLRHGWFEAAYRQYKTLVALQPERPEGWLRLASAAAGMGKVDEALRIERKVATSDGESSPDDPRRVARLHSAVRIARMLRAARAANDAETAKALVRNLKRTQVFTGPGTMAIVTWADLGVPLSVRALKGETAVPTISPAQATSPGLDMITLPQGVDDADFEIRIAQAPVRRATPFSLTIIFFDGDDFVVTEQRSILPARHQAVSL